MIVYADILFFMNFSLDYLILYLVSKGIRRGKFLGLCAFLGGIYSVLAIRIPILGKAFFQTMWAIMIIFFAFQPKSVKSFFRCFFLFVMVSFAVCGMLYTLVSVTGRGRLINGIVYFDYSLWQFFLLTFSCRIFLFPLFQWISNIVKINGVKIHITNQGKTVVLDGIVDTGCNLHEPLTGFPVMVAEYEVISEILSEEFQGLILSDRLGPVPERIYQVPFSTVGKEKGLMLAFMPESITVTDGRKRIAFQHILVGLVHKKLGEEQNYNALLPPVMTI